MPTLLDILSSKMAAVFSALDLPSDLALVRVSDRPDLAQFQCNGAMAAAKKLGKNPRDLAAQIVTELQKDPIFSHVEVAGPGFINLNVSDAFLASTLNDLTHDPHHGVSQIGTGQTVILDYGGPQIAKHMHVGHLRTGIVGDTLRRLLLATGYNAIGDIHLGDWGLQMGMVISELEHRFPNLPYFDQGFTGEYPSESPVPFDDMGELYPSAAQACKSDPARMEKARKATLDLQQKRPGYMALWRNIMRVSIDAMRENYTALNVHFDLWKGEYDADYLIPEMIKTLKEKSYTVLSDGAWIVPVARNDDKKEMPPLLLVKSDGAYLYSTTDLATIVDRSRNYTPAWCIYVVDQRQGLHFEQVFRAAKMSGIAPEHLRLDFAGIGTMNGPDGKPFKTRAGGVLRLQDLIQMAIDKAHARMDAAQIGADWDKAEKESVARAVAVAAIKFADLKNQRHVDYVFDLDAMTSFEGKTGPYLLYQAVRMTSILERAKTQGYQPSDKIAVDDATRNLALLIADYPNAVTLSAAPTNLSAHILADYLHRLAQEFSQFYARCHILNEPDTTRRAHWLAACRAAHNILTHGLSLMGIDVPNRM